MSVSYIKNAFARSRWALWFALGNALLCALISLRFLAPIDFNANLISIAYVASYWVAHFSVLGLGAWLVALLPLAFLLPVAALYRFLGVVLFFVVQFVLLIDTFVFLHYRFHINRFILDLIINDTEGQIFAFSSNAWFMAAVFAALLLVAELLFAQWLWRRIESRARFAFSRPLAIVCLTITLAAHVGHIWADANAYQPVTNYNKLLPLSHPTTSYKLMTKYGLADPEAYAKRDSMKVENVANSLNYPLAPLKCQPQETPLNVLLIVIDSWRADALAADVTPHLAAFAEKSNRFQQHFSGSNSTRAGIFSLFYGLPGHYWLAMKDSQTPPVLIRELLNQDYQFGVFTSARLDNPRFNQTVFQPIKNLRLDSPGNETWERDVNLTRDWQAWFSSERDQERPFFGFLFYDSPHGFSFPSDYPKPFEPSWEQVNQMLLTDDFDATPFFNRYRNAVHFTDSLVAQVLEQLEEQGHLDDTVIIITGDHGEEFNDNKRGFWGHNGNFSPVQVQVPMLVSWPGRSDLQKQDYWTSHYDVAPTLLQDLLGCSGDPADYGIGTNLYTRQGRRDWLLVASYSRYAILEKDRITEIDAVGNYSIYDHTYTPFRDVELRYEAMLEAVDQIRRFSGK